MARASIPWMVAAGSICLAVAGWLGRPTPRAERQAAPPPDATRTLSALGASLAAEKAENAALRSELDRLAARPATASRSVVSGEETRPVVEETQSAAAERLRELAARYQDDLRRALAGDEEARENAYREIMDLVRSGPGAFPALRDAYLGAADPAARAIILRALIAGRGTELPEFVAAELRNEKDPELRRALATKASELAIPSAAATFKEGLLDLLGAESDPEVRLAAVRGLRYAQGPEVDQALAAAAADASEDTRIAAVETLMARPEGRETVRALVAGESSARVREIGRCRLLLTE